MIVILFVKCGLSEPILLTTDKPNYKEPTQDSGTYAYKRINHLTEILSQLQAKESTDIPPKVFESIKRELKKRKINKNDLDIFRLRRILKKLNYRKYYEHVPHILQIINGKEPPNFSREHEMKIKQMFRQVQKPFAIYCPKNRKNFLNYSYVLHKFCELLDLDEYISYFPLLKNNAKLLQHDKIWKNICEYMRWEFYKSI
nr:A2L transcription factor [Mimivirus sp.]